MSAVITTRAAAVDAAPEGKAPRRPVHTVVGILILAFMLFRCTG